MRKPTAMKDTSAIIIRRIMKEDRGLICVEIVYEVNISTSPVFGILIEILQEMKIAAT
jgi:phage terminase large subunit